MSSAGVVKPCRNATRDCIAIHREMAIMCLQTCLSQHRLEIVSGACRPPESSNWAFSKCGIAVKIKQKANIDSASTRSVLPACL